MNIFRINTTAYDDEDFFVMTDLRKGDIVKTIKPIVERERAGGDMYDNDDLVTALKAHHPNAIVVHYNEFINIQI